MKKQMTDEEKKTFELQLAAIDAYDGDRLEGLEVNSDAVDVDKLEARLEGDTLALFVWHEIHDACGDPTEAIRMMDVAISELERVRQAMILKQGSGD